MSGGSYDYLYGKDVAQLLECDTELQHMRDRLAGLGYANDAARETDELLLMLRQFRVVAEIRQRRLAHLWRSVEWWDSCDSGEDGVKAALAKYRQPLSEDLTTPRT